MSIPLLYQLADSISTAPLPHVAATTSLIQTILDIVFTITGALSLLMITIGGFRYVLSRGDPQRITQGKDTILYALIGLVITISGFAIVRFVIAKA